MTSNHVRQTLILVTFFGLAVFGCSSDGTDQRPVEIIDFTDSGVPMGCIQPVFPPEQPDMTTSPTFAADPVLPGRDLEVEIRVNGATRKVTAELTNAWSGPPPIGTLEEETPGNATIPMIFPTMQGQQGRYYLKLTLCGTDCRERQVVFDLNPDVNSNYERTVIEGGVTVGTDDTCVKPTSTVIQ